MRGVREEETSGGEEVGEEDRGEEVRREVKGADGFGGERVITGEGREGEGKRRGRGEGEGKGRNG